MIVHLEPSIPPRAPTAASRGRVPVGPLRTVPTYITLTRTALAVALGTAALRSGSLTLLAAACAVYWVGDCLDGWSARRLGQETRLGAVLDIVCDRACTAVLVGALVVHVSGAVPVAAVFLLSFLVVDTPLSLAFLSWPLLGPNDFHHVDRRVWLLNWSPPAKTVNTAGVVGALLLGLPGVALALALAVGAVKIWSAGRVLRLVNAPC